VWLIISVFKIPEEGAEVDHLSDDNDSDIDNDTDAYQTVLETMEKDQNEPTIPEVKERDTCQVTEEGSDSNSDTMLEDLEAAEDDGIESPFGFVWLEHDHPRTQVTKKEVRDSHRCAVHISLKWQLMWQYHYFTWQLTKLIL